MAVDNVEVNSVVGVDGSSYTTTVSNDTLTNDDFLKLMLEEMKMQDPTKPMDSSALMDSQLKMSTIESNRGMADAMKTLQSSYATSALATSANLIGRVIQDGTTGSDGSLKAYNVKTVQNIDGELFVNASERIGYIDTLVNTETKQYLLYDADGYIVDADGNKTNIRVKRDTDGRFDLDSSGKLVLLDENDNVITDTDITNKYSTNGPIIKYSDTVTQVAVANIKEIF